MTHREPVIEVIADVIAAEGQHRERIAAHFTDLVVRGGRRLGTHRGGEVHAVGPAEALDDERHGRAAATAEDERRDRHALRVFPGRVERRALRRRGGEARVRMRCLAAAVGRPFLALPVGELRGRRVGHAFPPDVAVRRQGDVREDAVVRHRRHRVRVRLVARARRDAEEAELRIDRIETTVGTRLDPGDVIADRRDLPAVEGCRRDQHREVRLAAGTRERGGDVRLLAGGRLDAEDQHVFGEPALLAAHRRRDAQREALLAEQGVATVAAAERPDGVLFGEMDDVLLFLVAGPWHVGLAGGERHPDGVQAGDELAIRTESLGRRATHPGHHAHADRDIGGVRDLDADVRQRGTDGAHAERHDVQRAASHASVEQPGEALLHLGRRHPVVGRSGVVAVHGADVRAVFHTRDVGRIGEGDVAVGALRGVQPLHRAGRNELVAQSVVLGLAAVTPLDAFRAGEGSHLGDPGLQRAVPDPVGCVEGGRRTGHVFDLQFGKPPSSWGVATTPPLPVGMLALRPDVDGAIAHCNDGARGLAGRRVVGKACAGRQSVDVPGAKARARCVGGR